MIPGGLDVAGLWYDQTTNHTTGLSSLTPFGDPLSSTVASAPPPIYGNGQGLVAYGFVSTQLSLTAEDVERLDQLIGGRRDGQEHYHGDTEAQSAERRR
jgi:hypothetical protein